MLSRDSRNSPDDKENATQVPVPELLLPDDLDDLPEDTTEAYYTDAEIKAGYRVPSANHALCPAQPRSPSAGRAYWLAAKETGYAHLARGAITDGYSTLLADITKRPPTHSPRDAAQVNSAAHQVRLNVLKARRIAAFNDHINELLRKNGFINRVDIKKGITACVAVFNYIGDDPSVKAITKFGFVMVKLPPYTGFQQNIEFNEQANHHNESEILPQQTPEELHADLTYKNECRIISIMGFISPDDSRPHLLVKEINGQPFILNSPVFYDELEFEKDYNKILNGEYHAYSSSEELLSDEEIIDANTKNQQLIYSLLQLSFLNLSCIHRRLATNHADPVTTFNAYFYSALKAINTLHALGIVHSDIADRNIVVRSNGSVALVDFANSDTFNLVSGNATSNIRYPQISMLYNYDALKSDYIIGVITDYVSFQKTMLKAIANYAGVDFYTLPVEGIPNTGHQVTIEFLSQFTDRQIMDKVVTNLKKALVRLAPVDFKRASLAMQLVLQWEPYFNHDHDATLSFAELRDANNKSFHARIDCTDFVEEVEKPRLRRSYSCENVGLFADQAERRYTDNERIGLRNSFGL